MSEPLLELRAVRRVFEETSSPVELFRGLDFALNAGESASIIGESGTGKSTLLHLAAALDRPNEGSVWLAGREISSLTEKALSPIRSRELGLVFQFHFLLKEFNVLENVLLPGWLNGMSRSEARERARSLLAQVGLTERLAHFPSQLSGGERQRVALARALINDPPLLLADEPTGNLDERNSLAVQDLFFQLVGEHHKSLLLVTHDRTFAARAQRQYRLAGGKLEGL
jgi:lipoprotein-releasing system ATP-binding protein